jgi:hypothetical protein
MQRCRLNGIYSFTLAGGGNYTITPSLSGFTFAPASQTFNNLSANQTADFAATRQNFVVTNVNDHGHGGLRFFGAPTLSSSPAAAIQFWGNNSPFPGQLYLDAGAIDSGALIIRSAGTGGTITERMRVTATGNVGIGTSNPQSKLDVAGTSMSLVTSRRSIKTLPSGWRRVRIWRRG